MYKCSGIVCIHLTFLGSRNVKINVFGEKIFSVHFDQIEVHVFTNWSNLNSMVTWCIN